MRVGFLFLVAGACAVFLRADVVECENGDRYNGRVLLVDEHSVKLQNDIAGVLTIPRSKVVTISFRPKSVSSAVSAPGRTGVTNLSGLKPGAPLKFDSASVEKVQNELLGEASPEANQMFRDMVAGLMSGKMDMRDLQNKARTTLDELKELQKDLGDDDAAALLSSYAGILENFLKTSPAGASKPAVAAPVPQGVPPPVEPKGD